MPDTVSLLVTRFAPSPTGYLHLGHAYAAFMAHDLAKAQGGRFLVRMEDIDAARCQPEFEAAILDDLAWLGLTWEEPVRRQAARLDHYRSMLAALLARDLLYPCFCTRKDIVAEIDRMAMAPQGPEGPLYPGTCRHLAADERRTRLDAGEPHALRLSVEVATTRVGTPLTFNEEGRGLHGEHGQIRVDPYLFGDIVLARKDVGVSYHLAVTIDDHEQDVTLVTRGEDLFPATHIQRLLQALMGFAPPRYHHHRLICHDSGRRLAKRDKSETLRAMRAAGVTPAAIRQRLGLTNP